MNLAILFAAKFLNTAQGGSCEILVDEIISFYFLLSFIRLQKWLSV